jgi:glycosyltransferase involved in cell wall biosynthesis
MLRYDLSIIIPTFERDDVFKRTIKNTIKAIKDLDVEIIVVNDSNKPLIPIYNTENLTVLTNPKKGAASARNIGAASANGSILLFIDNDVLISRTNIIRIIELNKKHPKSCFNFFWFYPPDLIEKLPSTSFGRFLLNNLIFSNLSRLGKINSSKSFTEVNGIASYFLSISRSNFLKIGGYDERIPKAGVEDMILSKELIKNNIKMYFSYEDIVYHNEADRLNLRNMMGIYHSHALTRKIAASIGHDDFKPSISLMKKISYSLLLPFKDLIYAATKLIPNTLFFDFIYFKLVSILLGLSTFEALTKNK